MAGRWGRAIVVVPVVAALVAACQRPGPSPAPSPGSPTPTVSAPASVSGLRVAVVLPPTTLAAAASTAALRADLEQLRRRFGDDVGSLRVVQPDAPAFVADVTDLLAERGADLVCVVGPGAGAVVVSAAARFPATEFCAAPATADPAEVPVNVLLVDVRVEEIAFLAGVAAQLADPSVPPGFVAGESQYAIDRQRAAYLAGINSVSAEPVTPYVGFPAGDAERAFALASSQFEAGVAAIYSAAGPSDPGVLRAAEEAGGLVLGSRRTLVATADADTGTDIDADVADEGPPAAVLLTTDIVLSVAVELALRRRIDSWEGGRASVGLAEGALVVGPGGSPRYRPIAATIETVRGRIESGELVPLELP